MKGGRILLMYFLKGSKKCRAICRSPCPHQGIREQSEWVMSSSRGRNNLLVHWCGKFWKMKNCVGQPLKVVIGIKRHGYSQFISMMAKMSFFVACIFQLTSVDGLNRLKRKETHFYSYTNRRCAPHS